MEPLKVTMNSPAPNSQPLADRASGLHSSQNQRGWLLTSSCTLISLMSCSLPSFPKFGAKPPEAPLPVEPPTVPSIEAVTSSLWDGLGSMMWLSILLLLFFPAVRTPIVGLWTAIFNVMALPFKAIKDWYDAKYG